jgi:DNA-binding MarR family transcriptional regulator
MSVHQNIWKSYYMTSRPTTDGGGDAARRRRRSITAIKEELRELNSQLWLLNHHVGERLGLKDVDLECLDMIARHGPLTPSDLARRAGLHPATMTGILDRLERAGWIARDRDPSDRRAVLIRALRERGAEIFRLYAGMNRSMDELCERYTEEELDLLAGFLRRTTAAGKSATEALGSD